MPKKEAKKEKIITMKLDLKKTEYLKTEIIEKEWITRFNKDICDGPKYLNPLTDSISLYLFKCFLTEPEKLFHKLSSFNKMLISDFIKQLK